MPRYEYQVMTCWDEADDDQEVCETSDAMAAMLQAAAQDGYRLHTAVRREPGNGSGGSTVLIFERPVEAHDAKTA